MPDWNKQISFSRKPKVPKAPAEPKPVKASFLKKEISFSRKPKAPTQPSPADAVPWWKREIGGKKKEKPAGAVPFWKKELGPKKKEKATQPAAAAPEKVPFWKKELGRKKQEAPVAAVAPEPVVPEPAVVAAAAPEPEPEDYTWLTETLEAYAPAPAPAPGPVPEPEPGSWPPPSDDPVVVAPWPPRSEELPPPRPAPAAPAADPAFTPSEEVALTSSEDVGFAPSEEPPFVAPEPKQPFWKKELALGRKRPRVPEAPVEAVALAAAASVPFWKRELSLGGKRGKATAPEQVKGGPFWKKELTLAAKRAKAEKPPKAERVKGEPFWKKELAFGSKGPKGEKPPKAEKVKGAPFWKRELSVGIRGAMTPKPKPKKAKAAAGGAKKNENATLVGLKIGASQVAAARIHNNGHPQLLQVARQPMADGVVVGGEVRDVEALAETLKAFFAKNKLPKKGIRLGIANNRIGVRTFEIGGIDDPAQLANAIRFRAQETLPIPLEEAVLDWQVLREDVSEDGVVTRRVLLVVAYRELVDRYVLACKKAGLRLAGIDVEAFAVLRALSDPTDEGDRPLGAQVVVNVGHDRSTFAVTDGRVCEFTRVLAWGGENLNVAIARALDITPSEAAPLKHAVSLSESSVALEDVTAETAAVICDAVRAELQVFARELVSSLRFYQNQPGSLGIAELLLTGGTAELDGLAAELESLTSVVVRVGDPFHRVKVGRKLHEPDQVGSLAVAIGLGIED